MAEKKESVEAAIRTFRRLTRKKHSAEEKVWGVLEGLRMETNVAALCRRGDPKEEGHPPLKHGAVPMLLSEQLMHPPSPRPSEDSCVPALLSACPRREVAS